MANSRADNRQIIFDAQTIEKIRNDDEAEFERLFRFYYSQLLTFAFRYTRDRQIAEDTVQNVFLNIWENRRKFNPKHSIKIYLYAAVKNQTLKILRHLKIVQSYAAQQVTIDVDESTPEKTLQLKEMEKSILDTINNLPEKCRIIFCMNRFDGLTYAEIAKIQKLSISTVETQMVRALKCLRKHFPV